MRYSALGHIFARFLGGAVFFVAVAVAASLISAEVSFTDSAVYAAACGGVLAYPFRNRETPSRASQPASGTSRFMMDVYTGLSTAMKRGVWGGIPFVVVISLGISAALAIASSAIDGHGLGEEFVRRISVGFWACGLYMHSIVIVTFIVFVFHGLILYCASHMGRVGKESRGIDSQSS